MKKIVVIIVVVVLAFVWFSRRADAPATDTNNGVTQEMPAMPGQGGEEMMMEDGTDMMDVKEFVVVGTNYKFSMDEIRVSEGDTVRIVFQNGEGTHDWKIDEFNAATKITQTGEEDTVEFVADKAGEFEYYCSVGQHRANGMFGKLIVE